MNEFSASVNNGKSNGVGGNANISSSDWQQLMSLLNQTLSDREIENIKLKVSKDYELKMKDLEKIHYERLQMTK